MEVFDNRVETAPPTRLSNTPAKLPRLTSLRFFAALAVVLTHVGYQFTSSQALRKTETYGYVAVAFFFVLSGFVLTWSFRPRPSSVFWWGRFAKIWPSQFVIAVFVFLVLPTFERVPSTFGEILDLSLLQAWWPHRNVYFGGNGVSWSLSCEIFFYAIAPLIVGRICRMSTKGARRMTSVVVGVLVLLPVLAATFNVSSRTSYWLFYIFPPYQLGYFLIGMLAAWAVKNGVRLRFPKAASAVAMVWLASLAWYGTQFTLAQDHGLPRPVAMLGSLPALLVLITAAATRDVRHQRSWLTSPFMVFLGTISFELYLTHKVVFILTYNLGWWKNTGGLDGAIWFLTFLVVSLAIAGIFRFVCALPLEKSVRALRTISVGNCVVGVRNAFDTVGRRLTGSSTQIEEDFPAFQSEFLAPLAREQPLKGHDLIAEPAINTHGP